MRVLLERDVSLRQGHARENGAKIIKRSLDILISASMLLLLAPLLALIACAVRLSMGSPILFRHPRAGLGGKQFTLLKFRTMSDKRGASGCVLPDSERITRTGRWLRTSSLDELPELWNVLRGDMSLVGPRPLLVEYLPFYTQAEMHRHDVSPGLTGLAQVSGRNTLSWDEKLALDIRYVNSWSLCLDFKILVRTIRSILKREGISAPGHATMPRLDEERRWTSP